LSRDSFAKETFPDFVHGAGYIVSRDLAEWVVNASLSSQVVPNAWKLTEPDDVQLAIGLRDHLGVSASPLSPEFFFIRATGWKRDPARSAAGDCDANRIAVVGEFEYTEMRPVWAAWNRWLLESGLKKKSRGLYSHQEEETSAPSLCATLVPLLQSREWFHSGQKTFAYLRDPAEAVKHFKKAVDLAPLHAASRSELSSALLAVGSATEAEAAALDALALNERYVGAYVNLALAMDESRAEEAVQAYLMALTIDNTNGNVLFNLGNQLKHMGRAAEAAAMLFKAVDAEPNRADYRVNLGTVLQGAGDFHQAIEQYNIALQSYDAGHLVPRRMTVRANGASSSVVSAENVDGLIAVGNNEILAALHYNLGNAYIQRGGSESLEMALDEFEKATQADTSHAGAQANLAIALRSAHNGARCGEAEAAFERAAEALSRTDPNHARIADLRASAKVSCQLN
jgi:tetratricopeptide (TPR) repeat protein